MVVGVFWRMLGADEVTGKEARHIEKAVDFISLFLANAPMFSTEMMFSMDNATPGLLRCRAAQPWRPA
jgi:hypothetical protein